MATRDPMTFPWLFWIAAVLISFLVLEIIGYVQYGRPGTLSAHVQDWSNVHPLVPFGLGVGVGLLAYHLWQTQALPIRLAP
jgi:hypothetical protein